MSTTIDIHDLPARLEEVRQLSSGSEITVTDGTSPIARLVPLSVDRLKDAFAGEFTAEDIGLAKQLLASRPRCYTTEQVKAVLQALEGQ